MLRPAEWRLIRAPGFDEELEVLARTGSRTDAILGGWAFYLARDPMRFSYGLTMEDDEMRLISTVDPHEGAEYFAGLWVDQRHQTVYLTWVQRREVD
jgi:hypothetical protein